jgi:DNA-binding NarL/FixJ family response regulator
MKPIRVLIVDDHALFREALRSLLAARSEIQVVGEASNGREALAQLESESPDVVLMDMKMPELGGVETIRRIRAQKPAVKVIVLTTFEDDQLVFEGLRAGAMGYLLKDASSERLLEAIHTVAEGQSFLQPTVAAKLVAEFSRLAARPTVDNLMLLSNREREVVRLLARGASNRSIASALFLAEGTVKNHITNIFTKMGVSDRTQAALKARDLGLL